MNDSEWEDYNDKINKSKHAEESRYVLLVDDEPVNISLYNLFVWMHHYAAKNNREKYNKTESGMSYKIIYTNYYFSVH